MERTFYKLLVVGLTGIAIAFAFAMIEQILLIFEQIDRGYSTGMLTISVLFLFAIGRFLVALVALYWFPKIIKKLFPEVS